MLRCMNQILRASEYHTNKTYSDTLCEQRQYRQYETCPEAQTSLLRVQPLTPELTYRAQKSKKIENCRRLSSTVRCAPFRSVILVHHPSVLAIKPWQFRRRTVTITLPQERKCKKPGSFRSRLLSSPGLTTPELHAGSALRYNLFCDFEILMKIRIF